jgi:hypothetical protein
MVHAVKGNSRTPFRGLMAAEREDPIFVRWFTFMVLE